MAVKKLKKLEIAINAHRSGNIDKAEDLYKEVLIAHPDDPDANHNLGVIEVSREHYREATTLFEKAIRGNPDVEQFWLSYLDFLVLSRQFDKIEQVILDLQVKSFSGQVLAKLSDKIDLAKSSHESAEGPPKDMLRNLEDHYQRGDYKKAVSLAASITRKFPKDKFSWKILGVLLGPLGKRVEALQANQIAENLDPLDPAIQINLGATLQVMGRFEEAISHFEKAIKLKSSDPMPHSNLGIVLKQLGRFPEAEGHLKKAIKLNPLYAEAHKTLAGVFREQNRFNEAMEHYETANKLNADLPELFGEWFYLKQKICCWREFSQDLEELSTRVREDLLAAPPFLLHTVVEDPDLIRKGTEICTRNRYPKSSILPELRPNFGHQKIRIGYFSPDFYHHPVATVIADLFKHHDRDRFEIHAFSFGPNTNDSWNLKVKAGVDYFHDVRSLSDIDAVSFSRSLEIDIAVDLTGYTKNNRTNLFAMSAAPLQIGYIGFLGTMGSDYYDYILADKTMIPEASKKFYSENIIYLPSYQVNSAQDEFPDTSLDKQYFALPKNRFIFCCFNNTYKITPDVFDSWSRILQQVEDSVLMLYVDNEIAKKNLKEQITLRGIDSERLIFGGRVGGSEYWSRYKVVDLFLDTFLYSACATASDALRMGCPVLTFMGESFSSRFGGSLLTSLDLPELITTSQAEYEERAVYLATHPEVLSLLRADLADNLVTKPLYNTEQFASSIELAFMAAQDKLIKGEDKDDIYVEDLKS